MVLVASDRVQVIYNHKTASNMLISDVFKKSSAHSNVRLQYFVAKHTKPF